MSRIRMALAFTFLSGCMPRLPVESPVRVLETETSLRLRLTSQPTGAQVFVIDAAGAELRPLGTTPIDLAHFVLRKEYWKFSPATPPPALEECLVCLEKRRGAGDGVTTRGQDFALPVRVEAPGYAARELVVRLQPEDLPDAMRDGTWTTHVILDPAQGRP